MFIYSKESLIRACFIMLGICSAIVPNSAAIPAYVLGPSILTSVNLHGVDSEGNHFFAVGGDETIIESSDGGLNWSISTTPDTPISTYYLRAVCSADEDSVWYASGYYTKGIVLKSTDDGGSWSQVSFLRGQLNAIHFCDSSTGFAVGLNAVSEESYIHATTNGGVSWTSSIWENHDLGGVYTISEDLAFVVGKQTSPDTAVVLRTENGGINWTRVYAIAGGRFSAIHCIDEDTIFVAGTNSRVAISTDGGDTWNSINSNWAASFEDIYFNDSDHGVVVGYPTSSTGDGVIYTTANGGDTWSDPTPEGAETFWDIATSDGSRWIAVGFDLSVYRSIAYMREWTEIEWTDVPIVEHNTQIQRMITALNYAYSTIIVSLNNPEPETLELALIDISGRLRWIAEVEPEQVDQVFTIGTTMFPNGVYFIVLKGATYMESKGCIVIH